MTDDWVSFALNGVGGFAAIVCLFEGTRRIGARGARLIAVLMVALGGLFCASYGAIAYWTHEIQIETSELLRHGVFFAQRLPDWGKNMGAEERQTLSLAYARATYLAHGMLVAQLDRSGAGKLFEPSQEDVNRRESIVSIRAQLDHSARQNRADAFLWWLWGLLAVLAGYGVSLENRPAPASPAVERRD